MSYKSFTTATDINLAFTTEPKTSGLSGDLRAKYYNITTPATKMDVTGSITEDGTSGVYLIPAFQVATEGKYRCVLEYSTDSGTTYNQVAIQEFVIEDIAAVASNPLLFRAVV